MSWADFDILAYLRDRRIPYSERNKNLNKRWVCSIRCPFPYCQDGAFHCGISPGNTFACWKCGEHGNLFKLLIELEGRSQAREIYQVIDSYSTPGPKRPMRASMTAAAVVLRWPLEADMSFNPAVYAYLRSRRYDPDVVIPRYGLRVTHNLGAYRFRIITPIMMRGEWVSYIGMDYTRKQADKYKSAPDGDCMLPVKHCLYNLDSVTDKVVVVEGVLDAWRGGDGFVATMGTSWTKEQALLLSEMGLKEAYTMYDSEPQAQEQAKRIALALSGAIPHVENITLSEGDPDDMDDKDMLKLRGELGL